MLTQGRFVTRYRSIGGLFDRSTARLKEFKMSTPITAIETLSVREREDLLVGLAIALEGVAKEALVEGNKHFAAVSQGMADAIRVNADDWAREDVENAGFAAQQASEMLSRFRVEHPHRVVTYTLN